MPLDEADKKEIAALIGAAFKPETIGAAVKSHIDGLKLGETIAAEVAKLAPKKDDDADKKDDKGGKKDDPSVARIAAMEKALADERTARTAAEEKTRTERLHNAAREALAAAGVPADRMKAAMAVLKEEGVLVTDAEGNPGWKGKDQFGADATLALTDAASKWAAKDGAMFLPPSGVNGTGGNGGRHDNANRNGTASVGAVTSALGAAALRMARA